MHEGDVSTKRCRAGRRRGAEEDEAARGAGGEEADGVSPRGSQRTSTTIMMASARACRERYEIQGVSPSQPRPHRAGESTQGNGAAGRSRRQQRGRHGRHTREGRRPHHRRRRRAEGGTRVAGGGGRKGGVVGGVVVVRLRAQQQDAAAVAMANTVGSHASGVDACAFKRGSDWLAGAHTRGRGRSLHTAAAHGARRPRKHPQHSG